MQLEYCFGIYLKEELISRDYRRSGDDGTERNNERAEYGFCGVSSLYIHCTWLY